MERVTYVESYYDDEEEDEICNRVSGRTRSVRARQPCNVRGDDSINTNELFSGSSSDTHSDVSRGIRQRPFRYTDLDVLLYKEEYYNDDDDDDSAQKYLCGFGCEEHRREADCGGMKHLGDHTSGTRVTEDISEIVKPVVSAIPGNFGGTQDSVLNETIVPTDAQSEKDSADRKNNRFLYTDRDVLLYKEEYYNDEGGDIAQRYLSSFGYEEHLPEAGCEGDNTSNVNDEDISEIVKRFFRTIPKNFGDTEDSVLNEGIVPDATQSGESTVDLKKRRLRYTDMDDLLCKKQCYTDEDDGIKQRCSSRFDSEKHCPEADCNRLEDHTSVPSAEQDISEIVERVVSAIPENFGDIQDSVLSGDIIPHDAQSREDSTDRKKYRFRYTDPDVLLYTEEYYNAEDGNMTQRHLSSFGYEEHLPEAGFEGDNTSNVNDEDISEIVKRFFRTFPKNFGDTEDSVLNEGTVPHATQSGESTVDLKNHRLHCTDTDTLLCKKQCYTDEDYGNEQRCSSRIDSEKHCPEADCNRLEDHTSGTSAEQDISEIVKRVVSAIPENFEDIQDSVLSGDIIPHDAQSREDSIDLKQYRFRYTDPDVLLYTEEYYNDEDCNITQRYLSSFGCEEHLPEAGYEGANTSKVNDEDISEIVKRLIRTIPRNVGDTEDSVLNGGIVLPDKQSGKDTVDLKKHRLHYTDMDVLLCKEQCYNEKDDDVKPGCSSRFSTEKHRPEADCRLMEDHYSGPNEEEDISETVKRLVSTVPLNLGDGDTQNTALNEDTVTHNVGFREDNENLRKILLLPQNLKRIIRNFKKCQEICHKFHKIYPIWNSNRRRVITELKEIADTLDKSRLECNIARIVAAAGGTVGGTLSVAAVGLIPIAGLVAAPLMIAGCAITMTGGSAALGTTIAEVILLKQQVKTVQKLLKRDEQCFQNMSQLLRHTSEYLDSVNEVFDFDIFSKFMADSKKVLSILNDAAKEKALSDALSALLDSVCKNLPVPLAVAITIAKNRKLAALFKELIVLHHDNSLLFESLAMTARIFLEIGRSVGEVPGPDVVTAVSNVAKVGTATFRASVRKIVSQGFLAGLGLAIDVTSLILTSIDVHKGSKCPKAKEVRQISEQLSNEFDLVKRIYAELRKCRVL